MCRNTKFLKLKNKMGRLFNNYKKLKNTNEQMDKKFNNYCDASEKAKQQMDFLLLTKTRTNHSNRGGKKSLSNDKNFITNLVTAELSPPLTPTKKSNITTSVIDNKKYNNKNSKDNRIYFYINKKQSNIKKRISCFIKTTKATTKPGKTPTTRVNNKNYSKTKSKIYDFMKEFLKKKFNTQNIFTTTNNTSTNTQTHNSNNNNNNNTGTITDSSNSITNTPSTSSTQSSNSSNSNNSYNNNNINNNNNNSSSNNNNINALRTFFTSIISTGNNKSTLSHEEDLYVELPEAAASLPPLLPSLLPLPPPSSPVLNNLKVINNNFVGGAVNSLELDLDQKNNINIADTTKRNHQVMQDVRIRQQQQQQQQNCGRNSPITNNLLLLQHQSSQQFLNQNLNHQQQQQQQNHHHHLHHHHNHFHTNTNQNPQHQRRPNHLFSPSAANLNGNENEHIPHSPSSEEDNSPTEMNNCRRLVDKPPLVKRLTMGLFGSTEDSRPLVHNNSSTTQQTTTTTSNHTILNNCGSTQTISDGYVNEGICEPEKLISNKFGDSCRQSLTAIPNFDTQHFLDNSEFNFKKKYLRETSSANSSPKIFPPAMLKNKGSLSPSEQHELKGAAWFQAGISREISVEILNSQSPGAFLVRQSNTKADCFVLSVRVPPPAPKVAHYLILRTIRGYKIKGFTKEFTSLRALITHHSVMPELLPVPLSLPRPIHCTPRRRNLDDFESYGSLRLLGILNMLQTKHNMENHNT